MGNSEMQAAGARSHPPPPLISLETLLHEASDFRLLARNLGSICMAEGFEIARTRGAATATCVLADRLEEAVRVVEPEWWLSAERRASGFGALLDHQPVSDLVARLDASGPIVHLAVLRAICRGPLPLLFARTRETLELRRGDPIPPGRRPTHKAIPETTPSPSTLDVGHLLEGTGFKLFTGSGNRPTRVLLDFSRRVELDRATWIGDARSGRFPIVATVHPWGRPDDLTTPNIEGTRFFGVWPRRWDSRRVLDQLGTVDDAGIAVLPELCLPAPEELLAAIGDTPDRFPALIVCGSAHVEKTSAGDRTRVRANRSVVTLNGEPLMHHCKIHPFRTKYLGPGCRFETAVEEDLSGTDPELRILAGTLTRLAVVICADLQDGELPNLIQEARVNMLLVPALTPKDGAFNQSLSGLASQNQGVSIIVNGTPVASPDDDGKAPALVLIGVPRAAVEDQTRAYARRRRGRRAVGRLDLNARPPRAMMWQPASTAVRRRPA